MSEGQNGCRWAESLSSSHQQLHPKMWSILSTEGHRPSSPQSRSSLLPVGYQQHRVALSSKHTGGTATRLHVSSAYSLSWWGEIQSLSGAYAQHWDKAGKSLGKVTSTSTWIPHLTFTNWISEQEDYTCGCPHRHIYINSWETMSMGTSFFSSLMSFGLHSLCELILMLRI